MAKAKDARVFNIKKRWLRRTYIPSAELYSSVAVIAAVVLTGGWYLNQGDNYDHGERDLDPALLAEQTTLELYTRPLLIWQEPGTATGPAAGPLIAPYPAETIDPQWQLAGRMRSFQPDNLFEKINGEAEKFLQLNFQQMHYLVLKSTQGREEIAIELYDHGDITHSIGIFSGHTSPANEVVNAGEVTYFETGAGMIGRRGKYFFRVAATELNEPVRTKVGQLVTAFNYLGAPAAAMVAAPAPSEPAEDALPLELRLLRDQLGIAEDAIAFAAQNVFQFDFANNFWFGSLGGGNDGPEQRAFIHIADSPEAAQELHQQLLVEFDFDYQKDTTLAADDAVVLKHRFLNTYLVMRQQGPYLYGAENLADPSGIPDLISQFAEGLN